MTDHRRISIQEETGMRDEPSWGVSFKIALHLLFLCIGVAWGCAELVDWLR
ncbi:TPA: hypothetical protein QDB05_006252 [Burkholderia vietnamiensis]|nr:hypothetical protein [Burkholderia vietnamiensis]HDR9159652.1 hypothetical protein [Burkholderia vietnamiensis]